MAAVFGWHGISLEHPDDWAPVALSGDRKSGYARLASPRAVSLQLRWAPAGKEVLSQALDRYLDKLSRDTRKAKGKFSREVEAEDGILRYRYRGALDGDGLLFPTADGRVAFLEAIGDSSTSRRRHLDHAHATFQAPGERWSVLGLDFSLPKPLRVEGKSSWPAGQPSVSSAAAPVSPASGGGWRKVCSPASRSKSGPPRVSDGGGRLSKTDRACARFERCSLKRRPR